MMRVAARAREHKETQAKEDPDLEMNGHDVLQNGKAPEVTQSKDGGRAF